MVSKLFTSIGFTICAISFVILILIIYITKKKEKSSKTVAFTILLILTVATLISEILYANAMEKYSQITAFSFCRIYIYFTILWMYTFIYYLLLLLRKEKQLIDRKKKNLIIISILSILAIITLMISASLPITLSNNISDAYVFGGPATIVMYVVGGILISLILITITFNKRKMLKEQILPMYFSLFITVVILAFQKVTGFDYNILSFLFTFLIITLYFTIESQDYKLVTDLKITKDNATQADKNKTEFLLSMSHEIKTPLSGIMGFSEIILNKNEITEEEILNDTNNIHDTALSLLDLLNDILDISKIELNEIKIVNNEYSIKEILYEIESELKEKLDAENKKLIIDISDNIPNKVYGDSELIKKSLIHILETIIKYSNTNITINLTNELLEDDLLKLTFDIKTIIRDNLVSLLNEVIANKTLPENIELDLTIAKKFIDLLNGNIEFLEKEEPSRGLSIKIVQGLPNISENKSEEQNNDIDSYNNKVLIIENSSLEELERGLSEHDLNVQRINISEEYLKLIGENKYKLIILENCKETENLVNKIKKIRQDIPPLIIIANDKEEPIISQYRNEGFEECLIKPLQEKEINDIVDKYFTNKGEMKL